MKTANDVLYAQKCLAVCKLPICEAVEITDQQVIALVSSVQNTEELGAILAFLPKNKFNLVFWKLSTKISDNDFKANITHILHYLPLEKFGAIFQALGSCRMLPSLSNQQNPTTCVINWRSAELEKCLSDHLHTLIKEIADAHRVLDSLDNDDFVITCQLIKSHLFKLVQNQADAEILLGSLKPEQVDYVRKLLEPRMCEINQTPQKKHPGIWGNTRNDTINPEKTAQSAVSPS